MQLPGKSLLGLLSPVLDGGAKLPVDGELTFFFFFFGNLLSKVPEAKIK